MVKAVLIDLDDTLIETQALYIDGLARLTRVIQAHRYTTDKDIRTFCLQRLVDLFPTHGYSAAALPQGFEDTLRHFIPEASPSDIKAARDIAADVFTRTATLKDGAAEAIAMLAQHFPLHLVTAGDEAVQRHRIGALPFREMFNSVTIVPDKTEQTYRDVLKVIGASAAETVMIGDSLKSDIIPATSAGLQAIFIETSNFKKLEMQGQNLPPKALQKSSLMEAARFLTRRI